MNTIAVAALLLVCCAPEALESPDPTLAETDDAFFGGGQRPNNFPVLDAGGAIASFSTQGSIDLANAFHTPQGSNGRHCGTCHALAAGWSIRPFDVEILFWLTEGTHPIFNLLDANTPTSDVSTVEARREAYSLLRNGLFRRGGNVPPSAEWEVIAVDDPYNFSTLTNISFFRRPLTTGNVALITGVMWDDRLTVAGNTHAGLTSQARGNVTGGQQGPAPSTTVLDQIVTFEESVATAQLLLNDVGRLDSCGARGGPEALSTQTLTAGRFDIYDAWIGLNPGECGSVRADQKRASIARGQELFNGVNANGRSCGGCHNVANNGTNANNVLFNIGTSDAVNRRADVPLYTLRNKTTGETLQTTDPGKGWVTGRWADLNRFKAPSLRGLAARGPYFHNGIAADLREVVRFYERSLGFQFTHQERADLAAFLSAL